MIINDTKERRNFQKRSPQNIENAIPNVPSH